MPDQDHAQAAHAAPPYPAYFSTWGPLDGPILRLTERGLDLHSEVALRFF